MKKALVSKILVLGIICLFVGVGVQPALGINTDVLSNENNTSDNDLTEVTFRICKLTEIIEHTVLLTQEESDKLDYIIDNVKKDLETVRDINEEKEVKNNAIVSFDNLGLLPDTMNCEEVQNVVSNNIYQKIKKKVNSVSKNNYNSDGLYNTYCSIVGEATHITVFPHISFLLFGIGDILVEIGTKIPFLQIPLIFPLLFILILGEVSIEFFEKIPNFKYIGTSISFGNFYEQDDYPSEVYNPASGWIHTNGLKGEINYTGKWYGQLYKYNYISTFDFYIGVKGFTGIQIKNRTSSYFMGDALKVHIGTEPIP